MEHRASPGLIAGLNAGIAAKGTTWLAFLYLAVCFFLAVHDPMASTWNVNRGGKAFAETAGSGSMQRQISFAMLSLFGLFYLPRWKRSDLEKQGAIAWSALLLTGWTILSFLWSEAPGSSRGRVLGLLVLILVAVGVCIRFKPQEIVQWCGLTTVVFMVIGVLCEVSLGTFHPGGGGYRFGGTVSPNEQGVNCALAVIASWYLWRKHPRNLFWCGAALSGFVMCILTKSRSSLIGLVAALLIAQILNLRQWRTKVLIGCTVGVLACALGWLEWNGIVDLGDLVQMGREKDSTPSESLSGRLPLWTELIEIQGPHPFLGHGFGGFWTPERITDISRDQDWGVSAAHFAYLDLEIGLGPIGVCLFALTLLLAIRRGLRVASANPDHWVAAYFSTVLFFCLVDGITDSGPVEISAFLCFSLILSVVYLGFCPSPESASPAAEVTRRTHPASGIGSECTSFS